MKFKVNQSEFSEALQIVSKASASKTINQNLSGIYIEAKSDNKIRLISNDLTISIEIEIEAVVEKTGTVLVPNTKLPELIKKLPLTEIEVSTKDNGDLILKSNKNKYTLLTYNTDLFLFPNVENKILELKIERDMLLKMLKKVSFSIAKDNIRPVLTGALLDLEDDSINMVSIDNFRMSYFHTKFKSEDLNIISNSIKRQIIPERTILELIKLLPTSTTESCEIKFFENKVMFKFENIILISTVISGDYINFKDLIPKYSNIEVVIDKEDLYNSIDRTSLMIRENKSTAIEFNITNILEITGISESGNINEQIEIEKTGNDLKIGFIPKYITDVLKVIEEERVVLKFIDAHNACIISGVEDTEYTYLVMPSML